jgi:hypothetical protein
MSVPPMDILSLLIVTVLGTLFTVTIAAIAYNIARNQKIGRRFRARLAKRVEELRLGKMAKAMGIDKNVYLHKQSVVDIEREIRQCMDCTQKDTCDDRLARNDIPDHPQFCPNEAALGRMRELQPREAA